MVGVESCHTYTHIHTRAHTHTYTHTHMYVFFRSFTATTAYVCVSCNVGLKVDTFCTIGSFTLLKNTLPLTD